MTLRLMFHLILFQIAYGTLTRCLTGYMTDVQDWVTADGELTEIAGIRSIDLSGSKDPVPKLRAIVTGSRRPKDSVTRLSLSRCGLNGVPEIFTLPDKEKRTLADSLQYLTLYGNNFHRSMTDNMYDVSFNASEAVEVPSSDNRWETGFLQGYFKDLRELDLRFCSIRSLRNGTFKNMPALTALYLGENPIVYIEANAFCHLSNLIYLDLSNLDMHQNIGNAEMLQIDSNAFEPLEKLKSLDFSNTKLTQSNVGIFRHLPRCFERLSICNSGVTSISNSLFQNTNMKYLDISGNSQILSLDNHKFIENLSRTLIVLYADTTGLHSLNSFRDFSNIEILKISNNLVSAIPIHVVATWKNLKILDLTSNRIPSWFGQTYKFIPNLKYLSLIRNNLNMISEAMIIDLKDVSFVGLSDNYFVCSCHVREFMEAAISTESKISQVSTRSILNKSIDFHIGSLEYEMSISSRIPVTAVCDQYECMGGSYNTSYVLFDYTNQSYRCYIVSEDHRKEFMEINLCNQQDRKMLYDDVIADQTMLIILMTCIPLAVFGVIAAVLFRRWWCLKYFCITVKNSAMLSIISNEEKNIATDCIYHYDVFVSYCNDDRTWVLDHLLPHVERDCNVSVCLHERDFQVGLSILENIVSCMDRSRAILLVISNKFLQSQWCQFEMHLAQHRLLETRREDLILVLLEDIPRRRRPHTLHYLMMTKTYIVFPDSARERDQFWRRMNRSLAQGGVVRETAVVVQNRGDDSVGARGSSIREK